MCDINTNQSYSILGFVLVEILERFGESWLYTYTSFQKKIFGTLRGFF